MSFLRFASQEMKVIVASKLNEDVSVVPFIV